MFYPIPCLIMVFQSTPSAWRETLLPILSHLLKMYFNPLPPHGGRPVNGTAGNHRLYFNPLPPHGGRLYSDFKNFANLSFQSTPSAWRETPDSQRWECDVAFQSTPSAWRETLSQLLSGFRIPHFNPLPPHGGRRESLGLTMREFISIHSLRMEGDGRGVGENCRL